MSIRKNGAVISVREDSKDKVFVPGWSKENNKRLILILNTYTFLTLLDFLFNSLYDIPCGF